MVAVGITGVLAFTIICGIGYVVARQLLNVARDLPAYHLTIQKKMASLHVPAEQSLEGAFAAVEDISGDLATNAGNGSSGPQHRPHRCRRFALWTPIAANSSLPSSS